MKLQTTIQAFTIFIVATFVLYLLSSNFSVAQNKDEYIECLVKTSDNILSKQPREEWTQEMISKDRAGNQKQGSIVVCRDQGWEWGDLEQDPKRFAIIRIPKSEFNESWLEPELDYSSPLMEVDPDCVDKCIEEKGKDCETSCEREIPGEYKTLTSREYIIPLDTFLTQEEINNITSIGYNEKVNWSIKKDVENLNEKIRKNDFSNNMTDTVLHGSSGTFTICPSGCDYTSLTAWTSAEASNLTGTGPCIANITGDWSGQPEITVNLDLTGWTTTADDYVKITTDPDNKASAQWDTSKYIFVSTYNFYAALKLYSQDMYIENIQVLMNHSTTPVGCYRMYQNTGANVVINNTFCYQTTPYAYGVFTYDTGNNANVTFTNNIFFGCSSCIYHSYGDTLNEFILYNNNFLNSTSDGVYLRDSSGDVNLYIKNTISVDTPDSYDIGSFTVNNYSNNIGLQDDSGSQNNFKLTSQSVDDMFTDYWNQDLSLKIGSDAIDNGTNLDFDDLYPFDTDIDGETRTGTWDIGADEYVSDADTTPPQWFDNSTNSTVAGSWISHNVRWTDDTQLHGYIFSFCNGTWNGADCVGTTTETTIQLQAPDTENAEDVFFDEDGVVTGSETNLICDLLDNTGETPFIKFNISSIPSSQTINDATLCMYATTGSSQNINVFRSSNQTWTEGEIDSLCADVACPELYNFFTTDIGDMQGTGANGEWVCGNVTDGFVTDYDASNTFTTFILNQTGSTSDFYVFRSKENEPSYPTEIPYLNVTYSTTTSGWANDTYVELTGTNNWSNVTKFVNETIGSNIAWRIYANDSSGNWNSTEVFSYNTTEAPVSTCDCSSIQSETPIDCSENCNIGDCDANGHDIHLTGSGTVTVNGELYNWNRIIFYDTCQLFVDTESGGNIYL